jgi:hypothetical protein
MKKARVRNQIIVDIDDDEDGNGSELQDKSVNPSISTASTSIISSQNDSNISDTQNIDNDDHSSVPIASKICIQGQVILNFYYDIFIPFF